MLKYIIQGGNKLKGEVEISGSKNASLPIIAATVLNKGISTLYNVPDIYDTQKMFEILKELGGKVTKKNNKYILDTSKITKFKIPDNLMQQMRSSVILAGALIGKYRNATFSYPGGCDIGTRPIDIHLKNFEKLGINISKNYGNITCTCDKITGENLHLDFPSVGATENLMLATCLADNTTTISNAAMEPEIVDLQNFLNRMGAKISGAGTNKIIVIGVKNLKKEVCYNIMPDRIETGTFLCAAAITRGNIVLKNVRNEDIEPVVGKLEEAGCEILTSKNEIEINSPKRLNAVKIKTMPYPGFPTDMQSIFVAPLCIAKGTSVVVENIFENRFKYIQWLDKMGAKAKVEGNIAIIDGVRRLYGADVKATDLRGGASLVIAALGARKKTTIENIEYILRGYENFDIKLRKLGAKITKEGG